MKPYGITTEDYGDTGCCPGHDFPYTRRWAGRYSSPHWRRRIRQLVKQQNRLRRKRDKRALADSIRSFLKGDNQ